MFSFLLFLFLSRRMGGVTGWEQVGALRYFKFFLGKDRCTFERDYVIALKPNGLCQMLLDSYKWGHQIRAVTGEWVGGVGWGLYCYIIQCRLHELTPQNTSTEYMTHRGGEKERERMGIELKGNRWIVWCGYVGLYVGVFSEDSALVSICLFFVRTC